MSNANKARKANGVMAEIRKLMTKGDLQETRRALLATQYEAAAEAAPHLILRCEIAAGFSENQRGQHFHPDEAQSRNLNLVIAMLKEYSETFLKSNRIKKGKPNLRKFAFEMYYQPATQKILQYFWEDEAEFMSLAPCDKRANDCERFLATRR